MHFFYGLTRNIEKTLGSKFRSIACKLLPVGSHGDTALDASFEY